MEYIGEDNQPHRPFMVHRALLGSMERFFGTLIEYHAGNFPIWLCPTQVKVLPISDNYIDYAKKVNAQLKESGIRSEVDFKNEKIGYKIREAEMQKIPYMFIVGQKEMESDSISVRRHGEGDLGSFPIKDFIDKIQKEAMKRN
jgi:threonyl-tRNA synthetase